MRRHLLLLCAAVLGSTFLGAAPATALQPTWLSLSAASPLLNENGDGYWESARVAVHTDADSAHWVLTRGARLVAEADLTPAQLREAQQGVDLLIDSTTAGEVLAAGTYTVTVTATSTGEEPTTGSAEIHVSTAPPLTTMTRSAAVIYPRDIHPGVAHKIAFRHRLDPAIIEWGASSFELVGSDGTAIGLFSIDEDDPLLRWDGTYYSWDRRDYITAPVGTYRARLVLRGYGDPRGPLSEPFRVSHGYRVPTASSTTRAANATRAGTLTVRHARLRILDGRLHYRATNRDWRDAPLVRTLHRVVLPSYRVRAYHTYLVIRGQWQDELDIGLEVVTPSGRVRRIDTYGGTPKRTLTYAIPSTLVRSDGSVRFRLLWTSYGVTGAPGRIGRTDSVGVHFTRYVWRGLA